MRLKKCLKDKDQFGHPIKLNKGKGKETHNSLTGGILTAIYIVILSAIIIVDTIEMLKYGNQTVTNKNKFLDASKTTMGVRLSWLHLNWGMWRL